VQIFERDFWGGRWYRLLPEREHPAILIEFHPIKQQSAFAEFHKLLLITEAKSHPATTGYDRISRKKVLTEPYFCLQCKW
jgi:hypothetical protein